MMIYLDNAATSGTKPKEVVEAVTGALYKLSANPGRSGHSISLACDEAVYSCREKVAIFFGASGAEKVIFTPNCTASLNTVIKGVLNSGDNVVTSSLEHNSVIRPLETLRTRSLITYDIAEVIFGDEDATVRSFAATIKPNTKMVICTHASNVTGSVLPIKKIGKLCRERGVLFCVDAAQSAGMLPINMKEMNIDYLCIAPHKGLYAPMGTGILIAEKPIQHTIFEGGTGSNSMLTVQPAEIPEGFESGTLNLPGVVGISAGIDFIKKIGREVSYKREIDLIAHAYDNMLKMKGIDLYAARPEVGKSAPVLSFNVRHKPASEVASYLNDSGIAVRAGLHCSPTAHKRIGTIQNGTVRISTSHFNRESDISALIIALNRIIFSK